MKLKSLCKLVCVLAASSILLTACSGGENVKIKSAADLTGKIIGVQSGTTGADYVKKNVKDAQEKEYKTGMDAILDLKNKRLDAIVLDSAPAQRLVAANSGLKVLDTPLTNEEYAIAMPKGSGTLVAQVNDALKALKADGTYDKLLAHYVTQTDKTAPTLPTVDSADTLTVATAADFPPFESKDDSGKIVGFDVALMTCVGAKLGKKVKFVDTDFNAVLLQLSSGKADMAMSGITVTDERKKNVDFSDSYYTASQVIIVREAEAK